MGIDFWEFSSQRFSADCCITVLLVMLWESLIPALVVELVLILILLSELVVCPVSDCSISNCGVIIVSMFVKSEPHPDGSLSSVWLLQAEDLRHHVVCGGMQQDPARGQAHHHIAAHRRQANRDCIWTCWRINNKPFHYNKRAAFHKKVISLGFFKINDCTLDLLDLHISG